MFITYVCIWNVYFNNDYIFCLGTSLKNDSLFYPSENNTQLLSYIFNLFVFKMFIR